MSRLRVCSYPAAALHTQPQKKKKKNGNLGEDHPANVRSNAQGCEIFVRLCETW